MTLAIATRLTLWGAGSVLAICTLLCGGLYAGLHYSLQLEVDTFLEGEVREFMVTVNDHPHDNRVVEREIRAELGSRHRHDLAFILFDRNERPILSSESTPALARLWRPPADWRQRPPYYEFQTVHPDESPYPFRTCSMRVTTADGRACTAQAAYRLDRTVTSLALFRRVCLLALGLALILSIIIGRLLARRSLRPVRLLTAATRRIGARRLGDRVALAGTGDELDQLAETINGMLARIEEHVGQVQRFTADASHELRSPLAALRGNAEVALTQPRTADELREVIEESIAHYDRLTRIAEDLLLLARADAGHDILRRETLRLDTLVTRTLDLYFPLAQDRGVAMAHEASVALPINADGALLRQLLGNLLDNALKYTPAGGRIWVTVSEHDSVAELRVSDTGPGIAAEDVTRVFDRFYRADPARSVQAGRGGAGLGLSICRTIARAHGGDIELQSAVGAGTTVVVKLPLDASPPVGATLP